MEISGLNSRLEDEQNLVSQLQKKIKELQVFTPLHITTTMTPSIFFLHMSLFVPFLLSPLVIIYLTIFHTSLTLSS